jgi:regulatory protein YycH of two-component signal transduction system YycFG
MSLESILFLGIVTGALVVFAAVLAYGDWTTRQAMREIAKSQPSSAKVRKTSIAHATMKIPAQKAAA